MKFALPNWCDLVLDDLDKILVAIVLREGYRCFGAVSNT